jgi:hypothetical protein
MVLAAFRAPVHQREFVNFVAADMNPLIIPAQEFEPTHAGFYKLQLSLRQRIFILGA